MTKILLTAFLAFLLAACGDEQGGKPTQTPNETRSEEPAETASLKPFADSINRLPDTNATIGKAARYFETLVPPDEDLADSAAATVITRINKAAGVFNEGFSAKSDDYFDLVYGEKSTASTAQQAFQKQLAQDHFLLQGDGEGGVYAAVDYDWLVPLLKEKTSPAVDDYLSLMAAEEKEPTLLDAGLAIDTKELAARLVLSESLLGKNLPQTFATDVRQKTKFYTGVLLFGSDNSPSLSDNGFVLDKRFAEGYGYLLINHSFTKAASLVKEWQAIVAAKDKKRREEWRKKHSPW